MSFLFTPSIRNPIKKSMSDRSSKSPDLSPVHTPMDHRLSASSNSDLTTERTSATKKSSSSSSSSTFHFFDSILTRSPSKPLTIKSHQKKSPTRSSSSSCPQSSLFSTSSSSSSSNTSNMPDRPSQARCLYNYNAIKEDELCVHRGEYVQLINYDQENRWLVRRHTNRLAPAVQGWLPDFVLGLRCPSASSTSTLTISSNISTSTTTTDTSRLSPTVLPSSSLSSNSLHRL